MLQPDLFHRSPPVSTLIGGPVTLAAFTKIFQDPGLRAKFMADYYLPALAYENLEKTLGAVLEHIGGASALPGPRRARRATAWAATPASARRRSSETGSPRPPRTTRGASSPISLDSPHARAKTIKSRVYLGPAIGDLPPEAETKLRAAFDAAHVRYEIEHYEAEARVRRRRRGGLRDRTWPPNGTTPLSPSCTARRCMPEEGQTLQQPGRRSRS